MKTGCFEGGSAFAGVRNSKSDNGRTSRLCVGFRQAPSSLGAYHRPLKSIVKFSENPHPVRLSTVFHAYCPQVVNALVLEQNERALPLAIAKNRDRREDGETILKVKSP